MKRAVRGSMRGGILALLVLALLDPPLPGAGPRRRVYVIDASASVIKGTGSDAFTPGDALRLVSLDVKSLRPSDQVGLVAFGAKPVVLVPLSPVSDVRLPARVEGVDGSSTDLAAALDMAQALAEGGEIVLFSDGRTTTGRIPVERLRVPVHTFALGPVGGVDASIQSIDAPASAPPGALCRIRITVESTGRWTGSLVAGTERHAVEFTGPGRQDVVLAPPLPKEGPGLELALRLESAAPDACPDNDTALVTVERESQALRILIVNSSGDSLAKWHFLSPAYDVQGAADLRDPARADVILLERLRADAVSRTDLDNLVRLVREDGVGLVMLGGSSAFALGGWGGTPVEELLPFWAFPDERSAVVVVLDRSGSMAEPAPGRSRPRIEDAASAIRRSLQLAHEDDEIALVTFADTAEVRCPLVPGRDRGRAAGALGSVSAGGSTVLGPALDLAASTARMSKLGRRRIVLVTDGQSTGEEETLRGLGRRLREDGVGLTIVRTGDASTPALEILRGLGAEEIDGRDFAALDARLGDALARTRNLVDAPTSGVSFPSIKESPRPALLNRVSLKPGADVLARAGERPIAAVRPSGRGRVAAATFSLEEGWAGDLSSGSAWGTMSARLVDSVAPPAGRLPAEVSARFDGENLDITASLRGSERPDRFEIHLDGAPVNLDRRGENLYSKTVKGASTQAVIRISGRISAVARRPHAPEFDRVGPDEDILNEGSKATGGRRLSAPRDLASLPGRGPSEPRPARPFLLAAALLLFLLDVGAALAWRS